MNPKLALVTGASSGLGVDFARSLAAAKYDLIITARRLDRLEQLKTELENKHHNSVTVCSADLSDEAGVRTILRVVQQHHQPVHFLINNAGYGYACQFLDKGAEDWQKLIQVNVNSLVHLTRALLPPMIDQKQGRILNVASIAGFQAVPWFAIYAAAKAFVVSFSEALAIEVKDHNIKVSCLCPGPTKTEFAQISGSDKRKTPDFIWQTSPGVVTEGMNALEAGKVVCIPGLFNKIQVHIQRFFPRKLITRIAGSIYRFD